jgi:hypothetical protein
MTQADINRSAIEDLRIAEKRRAAALHELQEALNSLGESDLPKVSLVDDAWERYRDALADFEGKVWGDNGTIALTVKKSIERELTDEYVTRIERLLSGLRKSGLIK